MKGVKNMFNPDQLDLLCSINVELNNDTDYDDDTLINYHDIITDKYLSEFDKYGNPTNNAIIFEQIIDIFFDKLNI